MALSQHISLSPREVSDKAEMMVKYAFIRITLLIEYNPEAKIQPKVHTQKRQVFIGVRSIKKHFQIL